MESGKKGNTLVETIRRSPLWTCSLELSKYWGVGMEYSVLNVVMKRVVCV